MVGTIFTIIFLNKFYLIHKKIYAITSLLELVLGTITFSPLIFFALILIAATFLSGSQFCLSALDKDFVFIVINLFYKYIQNFIVVLYFKLFRKTIKKLYTKL